MTRIEAQIYAALAGDDDNVFTLDAIAGLYARAHSAPYRIYRRIQWELLDAHIKAKRGQRALNYLRREALRQTQQ